MTTAPTPPRPSDPAPGSQTREADPRPAGPTAAPIRLPRGIDPVALLTVVRITVARQNRGLRLLVLAALFALPIVFAVLIRRYQTPYRPASVEGSLLFGLIFPALVPLIGALARLGHGSG